MDIIGGLCPIGDPAFNVARFKERPVKEADTMKIKFTGIISLVLTIVGVWAQEPPASEAVHGHALTVKVVNGTQGGEVAEGSPVTVHFYQNGQLLEQTSAVTDSEGTCTILDIPTGSDVAAVAQAKHANMMFSSSPVKLGDHPHGVTLTVTVFDVVYDNTLIRAGTHHIIIKRHGESIQVTEYLQLINDQDKAILANQKDTQGKPIVVQVDLPEGFRNLRFSSYFDPQAVVMTESGFYDTMAIPPGQYHAVFTYELSARDDVIEFKKDMTLPLHSVMIFVQTNNMTASGLGEPTGQMTLQDGLQTEYYNVDVSQDAVIQFQLELLKLPQDAADRTWWILTAVFGVVVVLGLFRLMKNAGAKGA